MAAPAPELVPLVRRLLESDPWSTGLPVRLCNLMSRGALPGLADLLAMTEQELEWIPGIGRRTRCAFDGWVQRQTELLGRRLTHAQVRELVARPEHSAARSDLAAAEQEALRSWPPQPALRALRGLESELAGVPIRELGELPARTQRWIENHGIATLGDLTGAFSRGAWRARNLGERSLDALARAVAELRRRIAEAPPGALVDARLEHDRLREPLAAGLSDFATTLRERDRAILWRRILSEPPATLQILGDEFGLTRERVRQLEEKVLRRLVGAGISGDLVDARLLEARAPRAEPLWLSELSGLDPWFAGSEAWLRRLLEALDAQHRVVSVDDRQLVTAIAGADPSSLLRAACAHLDATCASSADRGAVEAELRSFLTQQGVPELWSVLVASGALSRTRRGFGQRPTAQDRVEAVLASEPRAFGLRELQAALPDLPPRRVAAVLSRIDVVQPAHGLHLLREHLRGYDPLLPSVRPDVVELMRCEPWRQWRVDGLHAALHEAGAAWTDRIPPHGLEHLLHDIDEVQCLARGVFALAAEHTRRLTIAELGARILTEHGAPMPPDALVEAIRAERDIGKVLGLRYPLVWLGPKLVGLATRDLGIDPIAWKELGRELRAAARRGEPIDDAFLLATLARVRPNGPPVEAGVLRRLVATTLAGAKYG